MIIARIGRKPESWLQFKFRMLHESPVELLPPYALAPLPTHESFGEWHFWVVFFLFMCVVFFSAVDIFFSHLRKRHTEYRTNKGQFLRLSPKYTRSHHCKYNFKASKHFSCKIILFCFWVFYNIFQTRWKLQRGSFYMSCMK